MAYCLFCSLDSSYLDTICYSAQIELFVYRGNYFTVLSRVVKQILNTGVLDNTHGAQDFAVFLPFVINVKMACFS